MSTKTTAPARSGYATIRTAAVIVAVLAILATVALLSEDGTQQDKTWAIVLAVVGMGSLICALLAQVCIEIRRTSRP